MQIAILGFGREGRSILKFLQNRRTARKPTFRAASWQTRNNAEIWILDKDGNLKVPRGIKAQLGKNYLKNLERFDIIFRSPGVPYTLPQIQHAKKSGVEISSATKLFFEQLRGRARSGHRQTRKTISKLPITNYQLPIIIGITGTKGKGTTSKLLYEILRDSGFKAVLAGNIGKPVLDILMQAKKAQFVILELSSFQLQDLTRSPDISVVLDIFPDHLDAHKNLKEYYRAKTAIGRYQKKSDVIFYFANNPLSKKIARASPARKIAVYPKEDSLRKNFEMATAVAKYLGCPSRIIGKTIKDFKGLEHRLELVRIVKLKPYSNVLKNLRITFYNDSAATNPNATAFAIRSFENPIILIAGGKSKVPNYQPLAHAVKKSKLIKSVILFGANKNKIRRKLEINNWKLKIKLAKDLKSAARFAYKFAKNLITQPPNNSITILFSPASASFDQFQNYADRGRQFKKIVKSLK